MDSHDKKIPISKINEDTGEVKIYREQDFSDGKTPEKEVRQRWKNSDMITSFEFALSGIWAAVREERNMRKHLVTAVVVIVLGVVLQVSELDWLILLMSIFMVIGAELMNSAVENVVDLAADYKFHMRAKRAKDMAAGSVLVISMFAGLAGLVIFAPRLIHLLLILLHVS